MVTIAEATEEIVNRSAFLQEAILDGIINYSALARKIKPDVEKQLFKDVQEGAIVMALKRMAPRLSRHHHEQDIMEYLQHTGEIIVRSDLVDLAYKNSPTLSEKQSQLLRNVQNVNDVFHASTKGVYETNIILSRSGLEMIEKVFESETMIMRIDNLASVTIRTPESYKKDVPGVFYYITKMFAWKAINVVEIISTKHEITFIVGKNQVNETFRILQELKG
ncbi:hypothetical protein FUAX_46980 (plasmid) [Fulvitalea axinellae]|uniref:ACT domain-containing protein n=1 Tax=Fulvitalea axinellae TaxID=1182444 RepID=A0AAU9DGL7_9BACT|nr:hypothetical protein FUAX_46980 [Fulvitalea axinellae]